MISVSRDSAGLPTLVLARGFYVLTVECTEEQLASLASLLLHPAGPERAS